MRGSALRRPGTARVKYRAARFRRGRHLNQLVTSSNQRVAHGLAAGGIEALLALFKALHSGPTVCSGFPCNGHVGQVPIRRSTPCPAITARPMSSAHRPVQARSLIALRLWTTCGSSWAYSWREQPARSFIPIGQQGSSVFGLTTVRPARPTP